MLAHDQRVTNWHASHLAFGRRKKMSSGLARQDFAAMKILPGASGGVEIFLPKPGGLGLACRSGLP